MHKVVARRIMALMLSICMIVGMADLSVFTVHAAAVDIRGAEIQLENTEGLYTTTYTGSAIEPKVTKVTDALGNDVTISDADYTISYSNNVNKGSSATVRITDKADPNNYVEGYFQIDPKDISGFTVGGIQDKEITMEGVPVELSITVSDGGKNLEKTKDFTCAYSNNTSPGTATVVISGTGNYTGSITKTFQITKLDGSLLSFDFPAGPFLYNKGEAVTAEVSNVKYNNAETLSESEYEVKYENNRFATADAKVWIEGKGRWAGLKSPEQTFTIRKLISENAYTSNNIIAEPINPQSYTGQPITLEKSQIKLQDPDYKGQILGEDEFELTGQYRNNTEESGTDQSTWASCQIRGLGRYSGTRWVYFKIEAARLSPQMVELKVPDNCRFDGTTDWSSKVTVSVKSLNGAITYDPGVDYTVTAVDSGTSAGTHSLRITPQNKLIGDPVIKQYEVKKCPLSDSSVITPHLLDYTPSSFTYDGQAKIPKIEVSFTQGNGVVRPLTAGVEYKNQLKTTNNINATTAESPAYVSAVAVENGNFEGETTPLPFQINPVQMTNDNTTISGITDGQSFVYTGKPITRTISVSVRGAGNLRENTDFKVEYENNINVGTATVKITGTGNFKGEFSRSFTITRRPLKDVTIQAPSSAQYTGQTIRPAVTLTYDGVKLTEGTDYTLDYGENIKVGSGVNGGSITITGSGNFEGTVTRNFSITPRNISGDLVVLDENENFDFVTGKPEDRFYEYTGNKIEPALTVKYVNAADNMDYTLEEGTDYTISFNNNTNIGIGKASVLISAKGNYTGTRTLMFSIKGNLSDYNPEGSNFTKITIPVQIFTSNEVMPGNAQVTFKKNGVEVPLTTRDFIIERCENNIDVGEATAYVKGTGEYFGEAAVNFQIRPMNLAEDSWEENGYVVNNVKESYIYSGLPIKPEPEITHNGNPRIYDTDYHVNYDLEGVDNINVGTAKMEIVGNEPNYEESREISYKIEKYDIGADYAADFIEVQGLVPEVVLDQVKAGNVPEGIALDTATNGLIQTNLKVMYTPADLSGAAAGSPRELEEGNEFRIDYEKNTKPGTAVIKITGQGKNFTGTITREFRIRGDLSAASMEVADWVYTPPKDGNATNCPEPVVKYTVTYEGGRTEELTLEKDKDYTVSYDNNMDSTVKSGGPAKVIISPKLESDGVTEADYTGTNEAEFEIPQRDLSKAIEKEGQTKDPMLDVEGLIEDGYEYTGEPIIPGLSVTCDGTELAKILKGEESGDEYDYEISAENNTNVYEYEYPNGPDGEKGERLIPTVTVTARKDADGNYIGNYTGEFQKEFKINPRVISEETVDTLVPITGMQDTMDYTGDFVTFPYNPQDPSDKRNALVITWSKVNEEGIQKDSRLEENKDYKITYENNRKIGVATVLISAVEESNYTGEYPKEFRIMATIEVVDDPNPPIPYMDLTYDHDVPYGIVAVCPDLKFKDYSGKLCGETNEPYILERGKDFEIVGIDEGAEPDPTHGTSQNNQDVAREDDEDETKRPKVVIRGIGSYKGVITRYYNIIPKNLTEDKGDITATFTGSQQIGDHENAFIYTGSAIEPAFEIYNHGELMVPGRDYTFVRYENNVEISTDERKAGVVIQAVEGSNYVGQKTLYFNIVKRPMDQRMEVAITNGPQIYDRKEKKPEVEVSFTDSNGEKVVLSQDDYDVDYANNINAAAANIGEDAPVIIINGKGAYEGEIRRTFTIERESLEASEEYDDFEVEAANALYTGQPATTTVKVKAKDGTELVEGSDFEMGAYTDNVQAGTGYVAIQGIGNYTGTRQVAFRIVPAEGKFRIDPIPEQTYTGRPVKPKLSVALVGEDVEVPLEEGSDYEVSYSNNEDAGTASVTVTGTGNFSGEERAQFTIKSRSINTEEGIAPDMLLEAVEDQLYIGRGVTPDVKLFHRLEAEPAAQEENGSEGAQSNKKLVLGRDYRLTYENNVAVGVAGITITGVNNYSGTLQTTFKIFGPMNLADVPKIPVQQYTGNALTPEPEVSFAGKKLVQGTDYTLKYENNTERGTATITITGMGWYTGTKIVKFDIAREFSDATVIKGVAAAYTYTGKEITPAVRVEDSGIVLTNGTDYQVSYSHNVDAGTATILITGINKYQGTAAVNFKITAQNLGRAVVEKISNQTYDGKKKQPSVKVSSDGIALKSGTDYTVVHVDNKNPGKASVIIKGKGNFTGTQTVSYNIVVPKVTGVKVSKYTDKSITFSWKRNKVVNGYEIYNSKNKRVARVTKNSTVKATVSKLKANSVSTYKVRAFVTKGQYYYSDFVSIKAGTAPKATSITSISSTRSKQVALKWKKVKGATKYQVYRSTSKKGKYKKIATTGKTSYTDKKATGGKTYYYKIRVYRKKDKKTYYSSYSPIKSVAAMR